MIYYYYYYYYYYYCCCCCCCDSFIFRRCTRDWVFVASKDMVGLL
jgi:hypothetical protein